LIIDKEDLDQEKLPFGPKFNETIVEFLSRQRVMKSPEDYPEGTEFECRRCGDCCRYNYYKLDPPQNLVDQLTMIGPKYPNGYWVLIENQIHCYMPCWAKENESKMFHFEGNLPQKHIELCWITGRTHGYWVLEGNDKIVIYCPTKCQHLIGKNVCDIYEDRPQVCREYICNRYPVETRGMER